MQGVCSLTIKECILKDTDTYTCKIEKQDDKTECKVKITGKYTPHLVATLSWICSYWNVANCMNAVKLFEYATCNIGKISGDVITIEKFYKWRCLNYFSPVEPVVPSILLFQGGN